MVYRLQVQILSLVWSISSYEIYSKKPSIFNHSNQHAYICSFSIIQNEITDEMNRAIWYLVYLQSKPLMQCNVKDWSSNNLKIKREMKFNLFLKSSLIRYVIFLLHVFFMNEKRFPLKISHKFYFNFTVSTEISSQQK